MDLEQVAAIASHVEQRRAGPSRAAADLVVGDQLGAAWAVLLLSWHQPGLEAARRPATPTACTASGSWSSRSG